MTADSEATAGLQELLAERQRYQAWLRALEERRSDTPAHVYDRVRTDYSLRLERVMQRLGERAEQLTANIKSLSDDLTTLRARESDRNDERHEWELRAAVGEFAPEEWERRRESADRELTSLRSQRESVEKQLKELEHVLARARGEEPAGATAEDDAAQPENSGSPAGSVGDQSTAAQPRAPQPQSTHEPSIESFVAERRAEETAGVATAAASAAPQGDGVPASPEVQRDHQTASRAASADAASTVSRGTAIEPRREAEKTLKCPECGAMNYATEWYCERCGGELSTF